MDAVVIVGKVYFSRREIMVSVVHGTHIIAYLFKWEDRGVLRTVFFSA
jgi:hypothetical protein